MTALVAESFTRRNHDSSLFTKTFSTVSVKSSPTATSAPMSGLPESGRRADIGRLSEKAIPVIADHHSRNGVTEYWIGTAASVSLNVGRPDHLAPFFNFPRNERFELVGGVCDCCCTQIGQSRFDVGVRKSCIRFFVKLVNNFDRCVLGNADTIPATRLIAGYKFVQRWHVRQCWPA